MMGLRVTDLPADRLEAAVVATFFFDDRRPLQGPAALLDWRLSGRLTTLLQEGRVNGRAGEQVVIANNGKLPADWVLFAGGGHAAGLVVETWRGLLRNLLANCRAAGYQSLALALETDEDLSRSRVIALVEELLGGAEGEGIDCLLSVREPPTVSARNQG